MTKFSKLLIITATAAMTIGATSSAFAWCDEGYRSSYSEPSSDHTYRSDDYGYRGSYNDHRGYDRGDDHRWYGRNNRY